MYITLFIQTLTCIHSICRTHRMRWHLSTRQDIFFKLKLHKILIESNSCFLPCFSLIRDGVIEGTGWPGIAKNEENVPLWTISVFMNWICFEGVLAWDSALEGEEERRGKTYPYQRETMYNRATKFCRSLIKHSVITVRQNYGKSVLKVHY